MRNILLILASTLSIGLAGCTTNQAILGGGATGAAVGALTTHTLGGALVGAGIGALAGAILVSHHNNGMCTYRYHGRIYTDRCR